MVQISPQNGTLTTVGAGVLTAALLAGQNITRTGPVAPFVDTFDTAALITAGLSASNGFGGAAWYCTYINKTASVGTLTAPAGGNFTLNGFSAAIPATSVAELLIVVSPAGAVTVTIITRYVYD